MEQLDGPVVHFLVLVFLHAKARFDGEIFKVRANMDSRKSETLLSEIGSGEGEVKGKGQNAAYASAINSTTLHHARGFPRFVYVIATYAKVDLTCRVHTWLGLLCV